MIVVDKVAKRLGGQLVLKELSFEVAGGQTVALLGLSGSGKTTALKIVCGLHLPDSGEVRINGEVLKRENVSQLRQQMGYVIQDGGLFPHLTASGNLELVGREARLSPRALQERIMELAALVRIEPGILKRYPRELSGGQRQRIGIMRAMLLDPAILLLDEPMGALDPITRSELQQELKEIFQRLRKSVLLVTHDLHEAGFLADKILLLNSGLLEQAGSMEELVTGPATEFVRKFVSSQHLGAEARR
jgi:osmoprotectant transport system ATP-binding protein